MNIKTYKITDLTEFEGNYNKHSGIQIEHLKRSLSDFNQVKNVVIWNNQIVCGNGLIMAAKELGWQEINALDVSHLTKKQAKALLIADNKTAEMAIPDIDLLSALLEDFECPVIDIPGITEDIMKSLEKSQPKTPPPDDFKEYDENIETEHECPKCGYKWSGGK